MTDWDRWHAEVEKHLTGALREDAIARADVYNDDPDTDGEMSIGEAFFDLYDRAEMNKDRAYVKACRRFLISIGYYRECTQHDIEHTYTSRRTVWEFTLDGKRWWHDED